MVGILAGSVKDAVVNQELPILQAEIEASRRLGKWRMQREAQKLLPDERVAFCMRRMKATSVDVMYAPAFKSAHYDGLMVCGSVWVCPLCAAKISERRRVELERAIASWIARGGAVYLATYTIAHKHYDDLPSLLHSFLTARKKARQGRAAQNIRKQFGVVGTVSVREVTWSKQNGWHPHCHELVFCSSEIVLEEYDQMVREQWRKSVEREGLSINEHGFKLDRTYGAVGDYIAKFGREPVRASWSTASELTKSHLKHGRDEEHLTPFSMLHLIAQGRCELKPVFKQYAQCFKGKHQLVWSSGLRALLLNAVEEKSDVELAQEPEQEEKILLGQLDRKQWNLVLANEARGKLLEVARSGDWEKVQAFLDDIDATTIDFPTLLGNTVTEKVSSSVKVGGYNGTDATTNPTCKPTMLIHKMDCHCQNCRDVMYDVREHDGSFLCVF